MKAEALRLESELNTSRNRVSDLSDANSQLTAERDRLVADTTRLGDELRQLHKRYD